MLETILAVQAELQSRIEYIRDRDIYIAPTVVSLNDGSMMPCIGIKDGKPIKRDLAGGVVEWALPIHISIFVQLAKDPERAIIGDSSTSSPGVLAIEKDIIAILENNLLGMEPSMQSALVTDQDESTMYVDASPKPKGIQRKQLTITYTKETICTC